MTGLSIPFTGLKKQYNNLRTEILDVTDEVLRSGNLMNGNWTAEFEHWLEKRNKVKYAVTCHSGTSALEIIAEFYKHHEHFPRPPRVLIPSLTYAATANAFMRAGWDIYFVDVDAQGLFNVKAIPESISFQAAVIVGLYGASITHHGDTRWWNRMVKNDLIVIEDAAQHWLAADCTRIGRAAAVSFDPMKNLPAYGNGGAVLTDDMALAHFARGWKDNGKPDYIYPGTNNRMSELDCAHMMVKTRYIDQWQERRKTIADHWRERLKGSGVRALINDDNEYDHAYHKFVIETDHRDELQQALSMRKIETKIHYTQPLHEVGSFRQYDGPGLLSCASALSRRVLSLPFYPELTDLEVEYVIDQVLDFASTKRN
jgi:dTDP-4-amino-4,6-dideoxygalactose transaminase